MAHSEYEPLSQQDVWSDVEPLAVVEGQPVVAIQYLAPHREALAYFRAILCSGEKSTRALGLTELIITYNSADYTAWQYRWECLEALGTDLTTEYPFMVTVADENIKNYQLWNHRRKVALALGADHAAQELEFADAALCKDAKNYHAWAHRQVIVKEFNIWERELAYSEKAIREDVRNNSAWNQRMFVVRSTMDANNIADVLQREMTFVREHLLKAARNESAWVYLLGLFQLPGCSPHEIAKHGFVFDLCSEVLRENNSNAGALDALSLYYSALAAVAMEQQQWPAAHQAADQATHLLKLLQTCDPIRDAYWAHRQEDLASFVHGLEALAQ